MIAGSGHACGSAQYRLHGLAGEIIGKQCIAFEYGRCYRAFRLDAFNPVAPKVSPSADFTFNHNLADITFDCL